MCKYDYDSNDANTKQSTKQTKVACVSSSSVKHTQHNFAGCQKAYPLFFQLKDTVQLETNNIKEPLKHVALV